MNTYNTILRSLENLILCKDKSENKKNIIDSTSGLFEYISDAFHCSFQIVPAVYDIECSCAIKAGANTNNQEFSTFLEF